MTIPQPLQRHNSLVEDYLLVLFAGHSSPLYRLMEYQLGWRDERGDPLEAPVPQPRPHTQETSRHHLKEAIGNLDGAALTPEGRRELSQVATWLALREGNQ